MVVPVVALAVIATLLATHCLRMLARARAVLGWSGAAAEILSSNVEERRTRGRDGRERVRYVPVVVYEYAVEGQRYESRGIALGLVAFAKREGAEAIVARHPAGAGRPVRYRPDRPGEAYLEPPETRGFAVGFALSLLLYAAAFWLWSQPGA